MDRLDAICMMLIAIGESLKNLDKVTGGRLLSKYPEIDWKGAKGISTSAGLDKYTNLAHCYVYKEVCDENKRGT